SRRVIRQLLDVLAARGIGPDETALGEFARDIQIALDRFEVRLAQYEPGLRRGVVHHDAHAGNALFNDNHLVALIDFDDAHYGFQVDDLGVMIENWADQGASHNDLNLEAAVRVVREYERIRQLTAAERELIPDFTFLYLLCDAAEY